MLASADPMTILVRDGTADDAAAAAEVLLAAYAEYATAMPATIHNAWMREVTDVAGRAAFSVLVVCTFDEEVVGCVSFYPDASREGWGLPATWAGFRGLAVRPSARGRGIGLALVQHCIERARRLGVAALSLHTAPFMTSAVPLYERLGFRRCPEYDVDSSGLFGANPARGDVKALAYRLEL
jgi:predicted N-acetyltransferase YhbS